MAFPCRDACNAPWLRRPHLTELTCMNRRFLFSTNEQTDFIATNHATFTLNQGGRGLMVLPKKYCVWILVINQNNKGSLKKRFRDFLLRQVQAVAELLAHW